MVPVEGRMGLADIALAEIAQGKLVLAETSNGQEPEGNSQRAGVMSAEIVTNRKALRDYHILDARGWNRTQGHRGQVYSIWTRELARFVRALGRRRSFL